jgi:carboxypeptidase PM20D1
VLCVNAARVKPSRPQGEPLDAGDYQATDAAVSRFCDMLQLPTVSYSDPSLVDKDAFDAWVPLLKRNYPKTFAACELTMIDTWGILLRWPGKDASLDPVVMMAHQDVVPVDESQWTYPPFEARIVDGEIWARGALDTKCIAAGFFEAAESLISEGYVPPRDVWYFSSCEEEITGPVVDHAVAWMRERGITPALVLDEGGAVAADAPMGATAPIAMVGVSEKGHVDLEVVATGAAGHASTPSVSDAPRILCRANEAICSRVGPPQLTPVLCTMLRELAAHSSFGLRLVFGNLWLFKPVVERVMEASPETAAMLRTTYALTQLEGAQTHNVIPQEARATINVRVAPFEDVPAALARAQANAATPAVVQRGSVAVSINQAYTPINPSPVSPWDGDPTFNYIHRVVAGVYPEAGFAPYIQNSCTDSAAFCAICPRVYRFGGFIFSAEARELIHAPNERIGVDVFKRGLAFYRAFLEHLDQLP